MDIATLRANVIAEAEKCLGMKEEPSGSNRGPLPDVALTFVGAGLGQAWCAAFASLMLHRGGVMHGPRSASSGAIHQWGIAHGATVKYNQAQKGDIGLVRSEKTSTGEDHTLIVESGDGKTYRTIEGNFKNGVFRNVRNATELDIVNPYILG